MERRTPRPRPCPYTDNGLTGSLTDGRGNVSVMEYDGFNRLAKLRYPNPAGGGTPTDFEQYAYNAAGLLDTFRNRDGETVSYSWDALERLTKSRPHPAR